MEIIAILILILFIYKIFSLSQNTRTWITIILGQRECLDRTKYQNRDYHSSRTKRILEQGLLLFWDEENVLYRNNGNPYSDIGSLQTFSLSQNTTNRDYYYSRTKRMFCIEIIVILILILFLLKHSLCPRIIVIPVVVFQDKENVWIELISE